ncbi:hypothetical protein SKAU_G00327110 [Synaphobranchus kaupii]|uniref:Uncharacterized protein n=1 Tax=Synaphobranchus kaupii TaxID=118154 RepID=A0A9Q1EQ13_SYNKA|nr:hypothetical protein SKAU_G00327110 [Synaphobranchus kaupii]
MPHLYHYVTSSRYPFNYYGILLFCQLEIWHAHRAYCSNKVDSALKKFGDQGNRSEVIVCKYLVVLTCRKC